MHTHLALIKRVDQYKIQVFRFQAIFQGLQVHAIFNHVYFKTFHLQHQHRFRF